MQRRSVLAIAGLSAFLVAAVVIGGCVGHSAQAPAPGGGGGDGTATFVGQAVCEGCHTGKAAEYAQQAHGASKYGGTFRNKRVSDSRPQGVVTPGNSCNPCHVVGHEEPSGFAADGSTPHLEGIGCEECHGAGSNHAAAPSSSNISREVDAKETCYDCHVSSYKILDGIVPVKTAADLMGTKLSSVSVHHPQAIFLEGVAGYEMPDMASPHSATANQCVTCHQATDPSSETFGEIDGIAGLDHTGNGLHPDSIACVACHGSEANAVAMVEHLEHELNAALIFLIGEDAADPGHPNHSTGDFAGAFGTFLANNGLTIDDDNSDPSDPALQKAKGVVYLIQYYYHDASNGVHNPALAEAYMEKCADLLGVTLP